jgi:hypothetical protein
MKIQKKTAFFIDYSDFEQFVDDKFGFKEPYEVAMELESPNYVSHVFEIDGNVNESDIKAIAEKRSGYNVSLHPRQILDMLCHLNKIEKGTYVIRVFW